jgi:hypothetical protein
MSADTGTNVFDRPIYGGLQKIRPLRDAAGVTVALMGVSGSAGTISVLRATFGAEPVEALGDHDPEDWAYEIAARLTRVLVDAGLVEENGQMEGALLLGVPGHLWTIDHHMAIRSPDGIGAVGSGEAVAIGALDAFMQVKTPPEHAVRRAAAIAVERDQWSRPPLQHEFLPGAEPSPSIHPVP